jgi:hypothetical protein
MAVTGDAHGGLMTDPVYAKAPALLPRFARGEHAVIWPTGGRLDNAAVAAGG